MAISMFIALVLFLVFLVALWKIVWASPKGLEGIPGYLGWPVVGESSSFLSEFSSPQGIYSFIKKRQQRYLTFIKILHDSM